MCASIKHDATLQHCAEYMEVVLFKTWLFCQFFQKITFNIQRVSGIRGCSHIMSAKIRGSWTPPSAMVSICHTPLPLPADVICEQPLKYYTCILSHCTSFKFNNKLHNVPNVAEPSIPAMLKCQMHPMASPSSYWCWPRGFSPDHIITLRLYGSPPII